MSARDFTTPAHPPFRKALGWFAAATVIAAPILLVAIFSRLHARGSPFMDEWTSVETFQKAMEGGSVWDSFFEQRTLHIVPIEALATHLVYWLGRGDMTLLLPLAFLMVIVAAWAFWLLAVPLLAGASPFVKAAAAAWITWVLFSPLHSHIWLWGLCWPVTVPLAMLCLSLLAARQFASVPFRLVFFSAASVISFFSYSSGLMVAPCILLMLLITGEAAIPRRKNLLAGWIAISVILAAVLAFSFRFSEMMPAEADDGSPDRTSVAVMARSFLALLGHPLSLGQSLMDFEWSMGLGLALALAMLALFIRQLRLKHGDPQRDAAAAWVAVMAFSAGNALLLAVTRGSRSVWPTIEPRYLMLVSPGIAAAVLLGLSCVCRGWLGIGEARRRPVVTVISTVLVMLVLGGWGEGWQWMKCWTAQRIQNDATLMFSRILPKDETQAHNLPLMQRPLVADAAAYLQEKDALADAFVLPDARLDRLQIMERRLPPNFALCTEGWRAPDGSLRFAGHADFPMHGRPADLVLLTACDASGGPGNVIAAATPQVPPDYYRFDLGAKRDRRHLAGWEMKVAAERIPPGTSRAQLWVADYLRRKVFALTDPLHLQASEPQGQHQRLVGE